MLILLFFCFMIIPWPEGRAHEPITTKIMYTKEVVRILKSNCLGCHRPGGIAPMSLATYEEARPWAKAIKEEVLERRMPPWPAVPGYGEFRNAPPLTPRDVDILVNWVEGGAPKGDPQDLPAGPLFSDDWPLGPPDRILRPAAGHAVAAQADERHDWVLPTGWRHDRWLTAIDLRPGNGAVVHCATFYLDRGDRTRGGGPKSESHKWQTGVLGSWVPGQKACELPAGVARRLPAGARLRVRIHYRGSGEAAEDRSAVGLYFAKGAVHKPLYEVALVDPPASMDRRRINVHLTVNEAAEAIAIRPRAHPDIASLEATAYGPDGTVEVLLWTRGARFDWQPTYYFRRPVPLPKGTRIQVTAYVNPPERQPGTADQPPPSARAEEPASDPFCVLLLTGRSR